MLLMVEPALSLSDQISAPKSYLCDIETRVSVFVGLTNCTKINFQFFH